MSRAWPKMKLRDACPIASRKVHEFEGRRPYYATGAVGPEGQLASPEEVEFATKPSRAGCMPRAGDVGFARMKGTKKVVLIDAASEGSLFSTGFCFISPTASLMSKFAYYYLMSEQFQEQKDGAAGDGIMGGLGNGDAGEIEVPVPSLSDQLRIVKLLDHALGALRVARRNSEQAALRMKHLFHGCLEQELRPSDESWVVKKLEDWCESVMDCVNKTAPTVDYQTSFKMVRTTNIRNGRVNLNSVKFVDQETFEKWTRRQTPRCGDVILTREAPMGEVGMLLTDDSVFLGQRLVSYRVDPEMLDGSFLLLALQSDDLQSQIHEKASGATVQHMRVPDTKNLMLAAPEVSVQRKIASKLMQVRDITAELGSVAERKLLAIDALEKVFLADAFSGRL